MKNDCVQNDGQGKPKILLVDDEEGTRIAGKYALEKWYDVTCAETTPKALELLQNNRFDLVLLDMRIETPESGINVLKVISKDYLQLPVVILTGTVTWAQKWDELKYLGASGFLVKPFEQSRIKGIVERCLNGEKMD